LVSSAGTGAGDAKHVRKLVHDERGDLYELAKILGHSNIKMTERYAKLAKSHIALCP
jgi:hypothetical protein